MQYVMYNTKQIMARRFGRTYRKRKKNQLETSLNSSEESIYLLNKWMGDNGFKSQKKLKPNYFKDTGRGLMTKERISTEDLIISIPEKLLITPIKILNSDLGKYFKRYCPKASGQEILSIFLMCEKKKLKTSKWYLYISNLPRTYDIPAFSNEFSSTTLLESLSPLVMKQINLVKQSYDKLNLLLKKLEFLFPVTQGFSCFDLYKWAWCTVNTRSVYINCFQRNCLGKSCPYHLALVPYLDLLNHNPDVQVEAGFNNETKHYEIKSLCSFKKYSQVFINYGPHDNRTLLIEYGFIVPSNVNDSIPFSIEDIVSAYKQCHFDSSLLSSKLELILQNELIQNANCSCDGLSWNLNTILKILASSSHFKYWNLKHATYPTCYVEDESKYNEIKKKLLSEKIDSYKNNFTQKEITPTSSYLIKTLYSLFCIEKLLLIKAI